MTDLARYEDVENRLGRSLTDTEAIRVWPLLADASANVRNYTRQTISQEVGDVARLKVRNGKVRLPQRPVTAVTTVVNINAVAVLYQWWGDDTISTGANVPDTFAWEPWANGMAAVDVTYTHGFATIPDDIIGVVCSIVTRSLGREPVDAGITSESIAGYSYSLGAVGAAGPFGLLQAEREILDVYRRVGGQINTSPMWVT